MSNHVELSRFIYYMPLQIPASFLHPIVENFVEHLNTGCMELAETEATRGRLSENLTQLYSQTGDGPSF